MSPHIITIAGSARRLSLNKRLARLAASRVSALGGSGEFVDLGSYPLPLYDGDEETETGVPRNAVDLAAKIKESSGLIIASPEFNGAYPALLKNTIDWLIFLKWWLRGMIWWRLSLRQHPCCTQPINCRSALRTVS